MFELVMDIGLVILSISIGLCLIRALIGPTTSDRIVALDSFGLNLIGLICIIMIQQDSTAYVEVTMIIGILAFIGSVALAKFLERGVVIDRDSH
ncbi:MULTISPECIES: Na(+)/H(+) antiporter subunit F1 [unclassified Geomicrobium]|uniref:Na(+)/H(+) antiporter subunit F1 n=1 Tax=unclassified Geomicrobium TaxID=2628951 RepID=UPI00045EDA4C|nr:MULTISPECIES: Na(+)/H(+) antiporter subunit F1 [unclassified Geomicrobium]EZH67859.1 cation:proton antiporter [Bacillaceae bacterium JMAK1]GAJ99065.1 Na(+) H(+) antiporter subunit F [Geomicrobium sp. JCM 19055]GAK06396.1 Na(+) H(+) antiporter subunit F [Geomicrobium sp. JCM 19038]